jgi:hypothetical protein
MKNLTQTTKIADRNPHQTANPEVSIRNLSKEGTIMKTVLAILCLVSAWLCAATSANALDYYRSTAQLAQPSYSYYSYDKSSYVTALSTLLNRPDFTIPTAKVCSKVGHAEVQLWIQNRGKSTVNGEIPLVLERTKNGASLAGVYWILPPAAGATKSYTFTSPFLGLPDTYYFYVNGEAVGTYYYTGPSNEEYYYNHEIVRGDAAELSWSNNDLDIDLTGPAQFREGYYDCWITP